MRKYSRVAQVVPGTTFCKRISLPQSTKMLFTNFTRAYRPRPSCSRNNLLQMSLLASVNKNTTHQLHARRGHIQVVPGTTFCKQVSSPRRLHSSYPLRMRARYFKNQNPLFFQIQKTTKQKHGYAEYSKGERPQRQKLHSGGPLMTKAYIYGARKNAATCSRTGSRNLSVLVLV
jgi:hypothetical protein